jgi:Tol biopolymer transport system component
MAALCALAVLAGVTLPGRDAGAAFPGQNGKIAFNAPLPGGIGFERRIDTVNPDGTGRVQLTATPVDDFEPAWSPNGQRIVYACRDIPNVETEICVINADGTGATALTDATAAPPNRANDDESPAFSGDGSRIVFVRNDGAPQFDDEIWVMNADGTGQTKLTSNTVGDFEPTFSPDSTRIAFDRETTNTGEAIFAMQANGSGEAPLTPINGSMIAEGANFSPNGSLLTFARCELVEEGCASPREIVTRSSTDPSTASPLTEVTSMDPMDGFDDTDPVFSPDGTAISFARQDFNTQTTNIFRVGATGGATQQLTTTGDTGNPDWQPVFSAPRSGGAAGARASGKLCRKVPTTIRGTKRKDIIVGTAGRDVVHGLKGGDRIFGLQGKDRLCGGRGWDKIYGDEGDDYLFGGDQHDFLSGGPGIDFLFGGTPSAPIKLIPDTCHRDAGGGKLRNCQKTD